MPTGGLRWREFEARVGKIESQDEQNIVGEILNESFWLSFPYISTHVCHAKKCTRDKGPSNKPS